MSTLVLNPCPMTEILEDVTPMLKSIARRFERRGEDFADCVSELHLVFLRVWEEFDSARGSFEDALYFHGYKHLAEISRGKARRQALLKRASINPATLPGAGANFCLAEFVEELSSDAKRVIRLVMDTPDHLADVIREKGDQPRNVRSVVKQHLLNVGWAKDRVVDAFSEITKALGSW